LKGLVGAGTIDTALVRELNNDLLKALLEPVQTQIIKKN